MTAWRIAVADDEPDLREYFAKILPRLGHEVVAVAATGAELVEQCRRLRPDLVITDIKMPDMDGLEAAARICRDEEVPIIIVSGYQDRRYRRRARQDYVRAYLLKPIKQEDLEACIATAMGS
ncbi:MAG: response regulator [Planctomycetota bacterium]|jgi:response regulator NasT